MAEYLLDLSDAERTRYRLMAANARRIESQRWEQAGIVEGAMVADVGCGPGAMLAALARTVGPSGRADGIDNDPRAIEFARDEVAAMPQASAAKGEASASGLDEGVYDVAVCRHVLAHNSDLEQSITDHLAALVRPGGAVYLVDFHWPAMSIWPPQPDLEQLAERYVALHARNGNDLCVGMRLGSLLARAGLAVEHFACEAPVFQIPAGTRPPSWAARDQLIRAGLASEAEVDKWGEQLAQLDEAAERPWYFPATFIAIGRKPAA